MAWLRATVNHRSSTVPGDAVEVARSQEFHVESPAAPLPRGLASFKIRSRCRRDSPRSRHRARKNAARSRRAMRRINSSNVSRSDMQGALLGPFRTGAVWSARGFAAFPLQPPRYWHPPQDRRRPPRTPIEDLMQDGSLLSMDAKPTERDLVREVYRHRPPTMNVKGFADKTDPRARTGQQLYKFNPRHETKWRSCSFSRQPPA